jgi:metal-responsive CopG/Arc/MetJ family transcriptional regulator
MSVAKVMISLPDELLERIDSRASVLRESRSGFLRRSAERRLAAERPRRSRREMEELLDRATGNFDDDAVKLIREDRESH